MIHETLRALIFFMYAALLAQQAGFLPATVGTSSGRQTESQSRRRTGQIAGYVTTDLGRPLARIQVTLTNIGDPGASSRRTGVTDERGGFQFNGIPDGPYSLSVRAPGYIRASASNELTYYRPGDFVAVSMLKGGVITGTVRSDLGEPLINAPVRALRIGDMEGKPTAVSASFASRLTDDRGVYRLYGLAPGIYVVCAGGGSRSYSGLNKYDNDAPTYHPSCARQTAEKVTVASGQEVTGIDIAYRGEKGHVVSGMTTGAHTTRFGPSVSVALANWSTREILGVGSTLQEDSFAFYGVPDGEYYLIARYFAADEKEGAVSKPQRIKVAGGDVTGLRLTLSALGSVAGQVVLEPLPKDSAGQCAQEHIVLVEDAVVSVQREKAKDDLEQLWDTYNIRGVPNDRGRFSIYGISAGRYRISASLSNDSWFARSVGMTRGAALDPKGATSSGRDHSLLDSVSVQSGDEIRLTVTLAEGAARLSGRVLAPKGKPLPSRLSVHLAPAEQLKLYDNVLRFFQADVHDDGSFFLDHIGPGRYWVFAKASTEKPGDKSTPDPSPWNAAGRATLRKEGQKSKAIIELRSCQRAQGYVVTYD